MCLVLYSTYFPLKAVDNVKYPSKVTWTSTLWRNINEKKVFHSIWIYQNLQSCVLTFPAGFKSKLNCTLGLSKMILCYVVGFFKIPFVLLAELNLFYSILWCCQNWLRKFMSYGSNFKLFDWDLYWTFGFIYVVQVHTL